MKFYLTGKRTRTITIELTEHYDSAEFSVLKKDVLETLDLPKVVDGDPSFWYDEVERAIDLGCEARAIDDPFESDRRTVKIKDDWDLETVEW